MLDERRDWFRIFFFFLSDPTFLGINRSTERNRFDGFDISQVEHRVIPVPVGMVAVQVAAAAGVGSWSRTRCRAKGWPGSTSFN